MLRYCEGMKVLFDGLCYDTGSMVIEWKLWYLKVVKHLRCSVQPYTRQILGGLASGQ